MCPDFVDLNAEYAWIIISIFFKCMNSEYTDYYSILQSQWYGRYNDLDTDFLDHNDENDDAENDAENDDSRLL